jgi:endonuclease/exonuclease/phosphatase family metal-dependent hydrolase
MRRTALIATLIAVLAVPAAAAGKSVKVMTRNLYLGGDITRPIAATAGKSGIEALVAFANANDVTRKIVDQTDFPSRAELLAAEIAQKKPDLVGLQEVTTWRRGDLDLSHVGRPDSGIVDYDFLKILRSELDGKYQVVRAQQESDVEGPAFPQTDPFQAQGNDIRLTIRDVILRRKASKVKIVKTGSRQYQARLDIAVSGVTFSFIRGAAWADAKLGKKRFRFITTHLESASATLALLQAQELLTGPAAVKGKPVIVVCDCNSDPDESVTEDGNQAAYLALTGQSPYAAVGASPLFDAWPAAHPGDPGHTSGFGELLLDDDYSGLHHRIDLVLSRGAKGKALKAESVRRTGLTARTSEGLRPSDHVGVVAKLRL